MMNTTNLPEFEASPARPSAGIGRRPARLLAASLLVVHAGLLASSAWRHSPVIDEVAHLPAGLSHLLLGRFELYSVNPPLVRSVAAVPVALSGPKLDWGHYLSYPRARTEFRVGEDFMEANGPRIFRFYAMARWACIPFSILGGIICYRWSSRLHGSPAAGLLALALWCFCPNVLGHGSLMTPDVGGAAFGVAACYLFWRWLGRPGFRIALAAGITLGLAELCKTTLVLLYLILPVLWIFYHRLEILGGAARARLNLVAQFAIIIIISIYIINLGYNFDGSFERLGSYKFTSHAFRGPYGLNRFEGTWASSVPVPLPRYYVLGMDQQKYDLERLDGSYLNGVFRRGGWWYYYLYGLAVKVPLGTWLLILGAVAAQGLRRAGAVPWKDEVVLLLPPLAVLAFVSSQTGFNHHLRYVMPAFPFAFIFAGGVIGPALRASRWMALPVAMALAWAMSSSLAVYPHNLSYFNELAGGPENGHKFMLNSNISWGQDLFFVREWLDAHPEAKPLRLAFYGGVDPRLAGVEMALPPCVPRPRTPSTPQRPTPPGPGYRPEPGFYAIDVNFLHGAITTLPDGRGGWTSPCSPACDYTYFLGLKPIDRIAYSIYVYKIE